MVRALLVLWMCLCVTVGAGAARADFDPQGLGTAANTYLQSLKQKSPPQPQPAARDKALVDARQALDRKDAAKAIGGFEQAITLGAEGFDVWMPLSDAWGMGAKPNRERATVAAFLAYRSAKNANQRSAALWRLTTLFEEFYDRSDIALRAARELTVTIQNNGDVLAETYPTLQETTERLRRKVGLVAGRVAVDTSTSMPRVCVSFADPLSTSQLVRFEDFVKVEPAVPVAASPSGDELCLTGFAFGTTYAITLRQGLPGADNLALVKDDRRTVRIGDRPPTVAFQGNAYILPRGSGEGIPLVAVNVDRVGLKVYRINDRSLTPTMRSRSMSGLSGYEFEEIAENEGELVWEGRVDVPASARNAENTLAVPFRQAVPDPQPGFYVISAEPRDVPEDDQPYTKATQWVLVTDIGLTAMEGVDGLTVVARSFGSAKPVAGAEVALVARNNAELARATTGSDGVARFAPGLARGTGGKQPFMVMAYAGADFAALQLLGAAFDLSDRGVAGRPTPGPMDAYLYTDRGVYRQGETVNLSILLRDDTTQAVENLPLTVKVLRPSGTEFRSTVVTPGAGGGIALPITLSKTAPLGGWSVQVYADPKGSPIGSASFQVDDFVPERLAVELTPQGPYLQPGAALDVVAKARFLYGPAAAGLDGSAELGLQPDPNPYPQLPGYRFGLAQEKITRKVDTVEFPTTDDQGQSTLSLTLPPLPDTTRPLQASLSVAVQEPGGRPTRQSVTIPVRVQGFAIGIKPKFDGDRIGEGTEAGFDVLAVNPDGSAVAKTGLSWELFEERVSFHWYYQNGRYTFRSTRSDQSRKAGTLTTAGDKPSTLAFPAMAYGRYRVEVADKSTGVATSVRFTAGWQPSTDATDTPDKLEITADKPAYKPGETAKVHIVPPFAGEVLLTVATDRVFHTRNVSIPAEGATLDVPVDGAWGPGAYVTATVYRPPVKGRERQPVRAIGLTWLTVDPAERTIGVTVDAPELVRPRQTVEVAVRVAAAGPAEDTFVTLAAVDEGILQLTDFTSPDPGRHYFGKRRLGVEIRDDYGRLIDALDGPYAALRQGGDSSGAGLPVVPFTVVSLFRGPIKVGADGVAKVTLDIPDFTGEVRLMAVAWSKSRVGSAARPMTVRDPLVADAALPRFLAPGDDSRVTLNVHNVEAPDGAYAIQVQGSGSVAVEQGGLSLTLAKGDRTLVTLPLKGLSAGVGRVTLDVRGPGGIAMAHAYDITVRPSRPAETQFTTLQIQPGASNSFAAPMLASYVPGTAAVSVTYSSGPPFDIAGILRALDRYPYGCLEQTVSRALPLLSVRDVEMALGHSRKPDDTLDARIDTAIARTLDRQGYDGSFGLWSANDGAGAWLTAYAMEFLVRAQAKGHSMPELAMKTGLDYLRHHAVDGGTEPAALASRAYALHVLSLAGVATPSPARYFFDGFMTKLPTPLSKAQVGAALARLGDKDRAAAAFRAATEKLARDYWYPDYGTTVRDAAAIVTLATEVNMAAPHLQTLVDRLPASETTARQTNTQEQAWLVLAADTLMRGATPPKVTVVGRLTATGNPVGVVPTAQELASGLTITNAGTGPLWQAVSVSGVPNEPRPAAREGLRIKRNFLTRTGEPLNLDTIKQNDVFMIVLEGEATTKLYHQLAITHPLPAGWEIENARLGSGEVPEFAFLGELSYPLAVEGRDDRYVAAIDLTEEQTTFKLAYLVRAVTPGTYELPGALVEDMYKPRFFARQPVGRITVAPARP